MSPRVTRAQQLRAEVSEVAHESVEAGLLVKAMGREDQETQRFAERTPGNGYRIVGRVLGGRGTRARVLCGGVRGLLSGRGAREHLLLGGRDLLGEHRREHERQHLAWRRGLSASTHHRLREHGTGQLGQFGRGVVRTTWKWLSDGVLQLPGLVSAGQLDRRLPAAGAAPDFAPYLWWFLNRHSIDAQAPDAGQRMLAAMRAGGWAI